MTRPGSTARRYGQVFDEVAAEYDRHRPTYPDELVDQACQVECLGQPIRATTVAALVSARRSTEGDNQR